MMKYYHPGEIEKGWLERWEKQGFPWASDPSKKGPRKPKYYALVEFPYPSGEGLHMGHVFTCTILDILARKKRAEGLNVLYPMGWDAFGLPTENYAIRTGIHPTVATKENTDRFRVQMKRLGQAYNWEREINTTDPGYYQWTQWIFLQLLKHGLAYKAETPVGWCPACKIILANEEIVNGKCERCGTQAEHRMQKQWLLRITSYADRLADELDLVDYPDYVVQAQRNWIGRTEGVNIDYPVIGSYFDLSCYSTRPDTNFGASFVVVAPEHPILKKLKIKSKRLKIELENYIEISKRKSELERTELEKEKTGVFTGNYALNRLSGKKMPIWIADFVVATAGTGVVVGVPAHDERDWQFAKKYGLEIIPVVKPKKGEWDYQKAPLTDIDEAEVFNSGFLNGLPPLKAKEKIIDCLVKKGWGKRAVNYHLRDWIFSRQHYWGEPIPMVYCSFCSKRGESWFTSEEGRRTKLLAGERVGLADQLKGWYPVAEVDLPVRLPAVERYQPTDTGESPLATMTEWLKATCPRCGRQARRETDTMPNWAGSSWYFLRYCDPKNNGCLADPQKLRHWLPVDLYLGGAEHTTLHLLYSRFWHKFLNDIGVVPGKEPYAARRQHGVILGEDGYRMSKSRGNVINPEEVMEKFGVDTLRVYLMFMGPYEATMSWSTKGVEGCYRFLSRVWRIYQTKGKIARQTTPALLGEFHRLIRKVSLDVDVLKHNTAIAAMMEFLNEWNQEGKALSKADAGSFLQLLAPFAPFLAEELWHQLGAKDTSVGQRGQRVHPSRGLDPKWSIFQQPWPQYDPKLVTEEIITIVVQVNGKVRGQINIKYQISNSKDKVERLVKKEPNVARHLAGRKIRKVVFVPGRLVNFVVA